VRRPAGGARGPVPAGTAPAPAAGPAIGGDEERWRGIATGAAAVWAAFYVSMIVQLVWYALTQPWVATPRPF
jgi:hypothetical protein